MRKYPDIGVGRVTIHLNKKVKWSEEGAIKEGMKKKLPWIEYMKFSKEGGKPVLYIDHMRTELMGYNEDAAYRWIKQALKEVAPGLVS